MDAVIPRSVEWTDGSVRLLDQTRLPAEEIYLDCRDIESVHDAISRLAVRGAPAIGIAAAYGLIVGLRSEEVSLEILNRRAEYLIGSRPTAVNLAWAVRRMLGVASAANDTSPAGLLERLEQEAVSIHAEDAAACHAIAEHGFPLIESRPKLLTHCNAGSLAVSELGTALAPIYLAHERGCNVHVFVDETRPLLQGARLTAFELQRAGVPSTLISDNMAAHVMSQGKVDAVIVGSDRVAANGDVANKIGTMNLAILCQHFSIPFFVACPLSTVDLETPTGAEITIEERDPEEVRAGRAPADMPVYNPAFDVTPASLVTAIITDRGVARPDYSASLPALFAADD